MKDKLKEQYGDYITRKCKDKNCVLKDIKNDEYVIINGDDIKSTSEEKSVDCIIFKLKHMKNGYDIILCELTKGNKPIKTSKSKFSDSGDLVVNLMNNIECNINNIHCLLLGNITDNGKKINEKGLIKRGNYVNIPTFYRNDIQIHRENCGYSINDLYGN